MGIHNSNSAIARNLKGLHLYHTSFSNCAARVRIALDEKGLHWESHEVDLRAGENISEWYFAIHPHGVVPALVDNGVVVIESIDILRYIDEKWPTQPLSPTNPTLVKEMEAWLESAANIHVKGVKTWIYSRKMRSTMNKNPELLNRYRALQTDPDLLDFHGAVSSPEGFSDSRIHSAIRLLDEHWARIDAAIADGGYLVGNQYTLADIAWYPVWDPLDALGYDFSRFPHVAEWGPRLKQRPGIRSGYTKWCPNLVSA